MDTDFLCSLVELAGLLLVEAFVVMLLVLYLRGRRTW